MLAVWKSLVLVTEHYRELQTATFMSVQIMLSKAVEKFKQDYVVTCGVLITPFWPGLPVMPVILTY